MYDRIVRLVIDGHQFPEAGVETGEPVGSPMSPILFSMYMSGVFRKVEKEVERFMTT